MFTFGARPGKLTEAGAASVTWGVTVRHLSSGNTEALQDFVAASRAQCGGPRQRLSLTSRTLPNNKARAARVNLEIARNSEEISDFERGPQRRTGQMAFCISV